MLLVGSCLPSFSTEGWSLKIYWRWKRNTAGKYHYYANGKSLCGKWKCSGPFSTGTTWTMFDCKTCWKRLNRRRKPVSRPDYKKNDPKGWCGSPARGAALGRSDIRDATEETFKDRLTLRRIRLNGDYDHLGTYWGSGAPLYWCASDDGLLELTLRASSREQAMSRVREQYPKAMFYGEKKSS